MRKGIAMAGTRLGKVEAHVVSLLDSSLPAGLHYHSTEHTIDFYNAAIRYGIEERLTPGERELLLVAALFHDVGYIRQYDNNEPIGAKMARETLGEFGYSEAQIAEVERLILATRMPQRPNGLLEQIACDCDMDHLGSEKFFARAGDLRKELEDVKGLKYTEAEWLRLNIKFLSEHRYFTKSAKAERDAGKERNLRTLQSALDGPELARA